MKTKYIIAVAFCISALAPAAKAGGKTGPCTPPTGTITFDPNQVCSGSNVIAIGKPLKLTADNLADKDCDCGKGVQDTINSTTGVQWSVGDSSTGTFSGGSNVTTGSPATFNPDSKPHTDVNVRLKLHDDNANPPHTSQDVEAGKFREVDKPNSPIKLGIVIPNKDTEATAAGACPAAFPFGKIEFITDTVAESGCTVDFKDLYIHEDSCGNYKDPCMIGINAGGVSTGTDWVQIKDGGTANKSAVPGMNGDDAQGHCSTGDTIPGPANCVSSDECYWKISVDKSTAVQMFTRHYNFTFGNPALNSTMTYSRTIAYP